MPEPEPLAPYSFITIRLAADDGTPVIDTGDLDLFSVYTILARCLDHIGDYLPEPRFHDEEVEADD